MEIHHFSHEHPLILDQANIKDDENIHCKGCDQSLSADLAYRCSRDWCDFNLHKFCAEIPAEIQAHPLHQHHPLILLPKPPYKDPYEDPCNACGEYFDGFTYHCSICKFDLSIGCAMRSQIVEHKSHKHPLRPLLNPTLFDCCACGQKHYGFSYQCDDCKYCIHQDCASLPTTIKHDDHVHLLTLYYSGLTTYLCSVCNRTMPNNFWCYRCEGCDFDIHVNCSTKTRKRKTEIKINDIDEADLIHHFSHEHPLILDQAKIEDDENIRCKGCDQSLSTGFAYRCSRDGCDFNLHKFCAEIPVEIQAHPLHQHHPLTLLLKNPYKSSAFRCDACDELFNGFTYHCSVCEFDLDISCAMRPHSLLTLDFWGREKEMEIHHFSHEHPLILDQAKIEDDDNIRCKGCRQSLSADLAYRCSRDWCDFNLHKFCAEIPAEFQAHPLHQHHPLILLPKPPSEDSSVFIKCAACYERFNGFTYRCSDCDFDLTIICAMRSQIVEHKSHKHPLRPLLNPTLFDCYACGQKHYGFSYQCDICKYCIHQDCASLPTTIKHDDHLHPLTLYYSGLTTYLCSVCNETMPTNFWCYRCEGCDFDIHVNCSTKTRNRKTQININDIDEAKFIYHFSHKHKLILDQAKIEDDENIRCKGCRQSLSAGFAYRCSRHSCDFNLHKSCAEIPAEIQAHPLHLHHPLIRKPPYEDSSVIIKCAACYERFNGFTYHCSICKFDLNISCAMRSQIFEHESHQHPLRPLLNPTLVDCCACGEKHYGFSYLCDVCKYWIHQYCALLPTTIEHHDHAHPLTLYYAGCYTGPVICGICNEKIPTHYWIYACGECRIFDIHVNCSTKTRKRKTKIKINDIDEADLIRLPMPDDSVDLIERFIKQISQKSNKTETNFNQFHQESISLDAQFSNQIILSDSSCEEPELLNHFSDNHPLTLFNMKSGGDYSIRQKDVKICNACLQPISASFYGCTICDFFLHKWCAELPTKIQHRCHPHPLILSGNNLKQFCNGCGFCCKGSFTYECTECGCYSLDVICASLPSAIIHELHKHPLLLREHCVIEACVACSWNLPLFSFGCDTCGFSLHYLCALLPRTTRHRWHHNDQHPFTLYYEPIRDGSDEYLCEICLKDIDPKWWFYHCIDCDQSLCAKCMHKPNKDQSFKDHYYFHGDPVSLTKKGLLCAACHRRNLNNSMVGCKECDITVHKECDDGVRYAYWKLHDISATIKNN